MEAKPDTYTPPRPILTVRVADPCPACGQPYGTGDLTRDAENRLVHSMCEPRFRAEYAALVRIVNQVDV